jgi:hypothetical protein
MRNPIRLQKVQGMQQIRGYQTSVLVAKKRTIRHSPPMGILEQVRPKRLKHKAIEQVPSFLSFAIGTLDFEDAFWPAHADAAAVLSGGRNPFKRRLFSASGMRCADFEDFVGAAAAAAASLFEGELVGISQYGIFYRELLGLIDRSSQHIRTYL